ILHLSVLLFFFFTATAPTVFSTLSLHDALPIYVFKDLGVDYVIPGGQTMNPSTEDILKAVDKVQANNIIILPNNGNIVLAAEQRSEEHTSELQSRFDLVCRLLLEKKTKQNMKYT